MGRQDKLNQYKRNKTLILLEQKKLPNDIQKLIHRLLHPLMLLIVKVMRIGNRQKIFCMNKKPEIRRNAIYAFNHSCHMDIPIACEIIKKHCYLIIGIQQLKAVDKLFFCMNGTVWIDRHDKASRQKGVKQVLELLKAGKNILYFPEGTWNLHPAKLSLPLYWGGIRIAKEADCPIIPVCLEYYNTNVYVKFGNPVYVLADDDNTVKINELEDSFSTLKWEIWEQFPIVKRATFMLDWKQEVKRRIEAYSKLDYEYEKTVIRKLYTEPEEVFAFLRDLRPCRENAFLLKSRKEYGDLLE